MVKGESSRFGCCVIVNPHFCDLEKIVCSVNFEVKMAWLWLGVGAKAMILVSCSHPKNLISKAYPNHTKMDKAEGLIIMSESPKPIHCEEKVVVVFPHPPKVQQMEEFACWAIHQEKKKGSFLHGLVVVATILEKMAGHNKTPTTLRNHQEMRLQRLFVCWREQQVESMGMTKML